jgi:hypothetical protein
MADPRILVFNPAPLGARLRLRDGRTVTWDVDEPVRALPPRDAADALRLGGMLVAEPIAVVAARHGLTVEQLRAVEPQLAAYTPRGGGETQEVVVMSVSTRWRLNAARAAVSQPAAPPHQTLT